MSVRSDQKMTSAYEQITDPVMTAAMLSRPIDWLESGTIPRRQFLSVQYPDLIRNSVGTVERIYEYFDAPLTPQTRQSFADYVRDHPRTKRPPHRYSLGTDEQIREERAAFKRYQDYFAVPNE
jgi:hypothetical protein